MVEENPSRWIKVKEGKTTFDKNSTSFDLQDTGFLDKNDWGLMSAKKWARKIIQWNKKRKYFKDK